MDDYRKEVAFQYILGEIGGAIHAVGKSLLTWKKDLEDAHARTKLSKTDVNGSRQTFIHAAITSGTWGGSNTIPVVDWYRKAGVSINARDGNGRTALHYAARKGSPYLIEQLLAREADPTIKSYEGKTPLEEAIDETGGHPPNANRSLAIDLLTKARGKAVTPHGFTSYPNRSASAQAGVPEITLESNAIPLESTVYTTEGLPARQPQQSAIFQRLTGVGRTTRKYGPSRIRRHARRRMSRRKVKA